MYCWQERKLLQAILKTVRRSQKILKIDLLYDPDISLLGINPKEMKIGYKKDFGTPMFIVALFTIANIWK